MEKLNNYESEYIKEELKWAINGIDLVGCGLSQNINKKLKEKEKEKLNLVIIADEEIN